MYMWYTCEYYVYSTVERMLLFVDGGLILKFWLILFSLFASCLSLILLCVLGLKICNLHLSEAIQCQYCLLLQMFALCPIMYTFYTLLTTEHLLLNHYTLPTTLHFCYHLLHIWVWLWCLPFKLCFLPLSTPCKFFLEVLGQRNCCK